MGMPPAPDYRPPTPMLPPTDPPGWKSWQGQWWHQDPTTGQWAPSPVGPPTVKATSAASPRGFAPPPPRFDAGYDPGSDDYGSLNRDDTSVGALRQLRSLLFRTDVPAWARRRGRIVGAAVAIVVAALIGYVAFGSSHSAEGNPFQPPDQLFSIVFPGGGSVSSSVEQGVTVYTDGPYAVDMMDAEAMLRQIGAIRGPAPKVTPADVARYVVDSNNCVAHSMTIAGLKTSKCSTTQVGTVFASQSSGIQTSANAYGITPGTHITTTMLSLGPDIMTVVGKSGAAYDSMLHSLLVAIPIKPANLVKATHLAIDQVVQRALTSSSGASQSAKS